MSWPVKVAIGLLLWGLFSVLVAWLWSLAVNDEKEDL